MDTSGMSALGPLFGATVGGSSDSGDLVLIILGGALTVYIIGYLLSLYWHPLRKCKRCGGSAREEGKIFKGNRRGVIMVGKAKAANPGQPERRPKYRPYNWKDQ
jgi:hypothetical protein